MNFYIVMQGKSYEASKEEENVWCDIFDSAGNTPHSWERMKEVRKGDVLFHLVKGDIVAISQAKEDCRVGVNENYEPGNTFAAKYEELPFALNVKAHFEEIKPVLPIKYSPFQDNGDGNQGFLYPCNELLALKLVELISNANIHPRTAEQLEFAINPVVEKDYSNLAPILFGLEAKAKGQLMDEKLAFEEGVSALWEQSCAMCGIDHPALLEAVYAKPVKDAIGDERVDPYNGLLLCANHAKLYEEGVIAFDGTGKIHISSSMSPTDYSKYNIHPKMRISRDEQHKPYVKWHKREVWKD